MFADHRPVPDAPLPLPARLGLAAVLAAALLVFAAGCATSGHSDFPDQVQEGLVEPDSGPMTVEERVSDLPQSEAPPPHALVSVQRGVGLLMRGGELVVLSDQRDTTRCPRKRHSTHLPTAWTATGTDPDVAWVNGSPEWREAYAKMFGWGSWAAGGEYCFRAGPVQADPHGSTGAPFLRRICQTGGGGLVRGSSATHDCEPTAAERGWLYWSSSAYQSVRSVYRARFPAPGPTISVTGPESARVGDRVTYQASAEGCQPGSHRWTWVWDREPVGVASTGRLNIVLEDAGQHRVSARNDFCGDAEGGLNVTVQGDTPPPPPPPPPPEDPEPDPPADPPTTPPAEPCDLSPVVQRLDALADLIVGEAQHTREALAGLRLICPEPACNCPPCPAAPDCAPTLDCSTCKGGGEEPEPPSDSSGDTFRFDYSTTYGPGIDFERIRVPAQGSAPEWLRLQVDATADGPGGYPPRSQVVYLCAYVQPGPWRKFCAVYQSRQDGWELHLDPDPPAHRPGRSLSEVLTWRLPQDRWLQVDVGLSGRWNGRENHWDPKGGTVSLRVTESSSGVAFGLAPEAELPEPEPLVFVRWGEGVQP